MRERINHILESRKKWRYCAKEDNPVDVGKRGTTSERLQNHGTWWEGPEWLTRGHSWVQRPKIHGNGYVKEERNSCRHLLAYLGRAVTRY